MVDDAPAGPVFLPSYPTVSTGPLHGAAYLYDNAAASIALVGCGQRDKAKRIGEAIVTAIGRDRFWHDGRLRNAYAAGAVGDGPLKLPGWWDDKQGKWLEDSYQVGSDNGNIAWAMLALLALDDGKSPQFKGAATRLGNWLAQWRDDRGSGGFTGGTFGHEPSPIMRRWKSTEHNTDLAAAFGRLAATTGDKSWGELAGAARHFVESMWDSACTCFSAGTAEDGVTRNPLLALDAQVWPVMAFAKFQPAVATAERRLGVKGGFGYAENGTEIWTEGTGQMAVLMTLLGQAEKAKSLIAVIEGQRASTGGYYATSGGEVATGFMLDTDPNKPRFYFHVPHLGATAWAALAERGFNPF